ncbi:cellulose binding domain-containing protein [Flavobacterium sp. ARAG 55.4]|uniref:cellulose binding domain-containing protein n=1 Tax=Flavobacterium sp. ARAG 55.4 TaxID=3451357 RepID=UPI003F45ACC2
MRKLNPILLLGILLLFFGFNPSIIAQKTFVHPGIPFTQSDLDQLKTNISQEPWLSGYNALKNDYRSQLSYTMRGPFATVTRAPDLNNGAWKTDMIAIHNLTFMYVFTDDEAYAAKATQILDAWATTNTVWGGGENMLDIGDYAPYFITAADILKSTYPGWTAANTTHVNNYFENVLYPASWVPNPLRDCNKGAIQIQIALGIAAFLDDEVKWNQAIESYRMEAGATLRNSLPSGQLGDTGRDDHWFGQAWALAWDAEVAYKQGVDMFAELDNRMLAIGELYNHYAIDPSGLTFTPYGGYSVYWTNGWGISTGSRKQHPFNNVIQAAYSLRKGIPTPYTDQMRTLVGEGAWSFLYLKSSDNSTATAMTPIVYPSENAVPTNYFSNTDIGVTGIKGSVTSNAGIWTAKGAGSSAANSNNFTFKSIKGDAAIIAKIENNSISNAVSGLMIRESLSTNSKYVSINFNPSNTINVSSSGATASSGAYTHYSTSSSWWLKLERVGNRVFVYHSADGNIWTNIALSIISLPTDAYIGFYTASRNTSALNTATFSNVAVNNTYAVGSPEINSVTSATATLETSFNFNVTAINSPTSYAATALPNGLSIDSTTGIISGTPTTVGQNIVLLEATNTSGTGKAALVINVLSNQTPVAVNNLSVSSVNSMIKLSWTATTNATSYVVKRSLTSGGPYTNIQADITGTSFIDPSPAYEVNNYYVVTALIGENESTISNEVSGAIAPAVPSNLAAVNNNGNVNLTWDSADGASVYNIKRATTSGGPYTEIASVSIPAYTDNNVTNGTAYYYVISSKGTTLESAISSEVFGNPGTSSLIWNNTPSTNTFNAPNNWVENVVPTSPAILTFKNTETNVINNDITTLDVSRIMFADDAVNYNIEGNSINLKSDLINNSVQNQTLSLPIIIDNQLNVNSKNSSIELNGVVSGTGSLLKTGTSALIMSGTNTYSGNTIIRGTKGYVWGSTDGIQVLGIGTGVSGVPTSGPLGTGKIILEGGALYTGSTTAAATLYNDIEVTAGNSGYFYERQGNLNLYGKLLGNGTIYNDGSDNYANISLYANNSSFTGTFITKLRSGNHRMAFMVPESGSANAAWLLDAQGADCHRIMFGSGVLEFGSLAGRGGIRCNVAGTPVIRIGALNTNTNFSGTIANAAGTLSVEKVGTGILIFSGNSTFGGATTILNGTFLLNNNGSTGTYNSPIITQNGTFGGNGRSTNSVTIGANTILAPGTDGTIGTFTTTGLVTLNPNATYKVDVNNSAVSCDKVIAANITLNQANLVLNNFVAGELPLGTTYTILENSGSDDVVGIFKDLPEMTLISINRYDFRITYKGGTGNDIQLLDDRIVPIVITSTTEDITLIGQPFNYTITGIKSPNSFTATGLPMGLNIETTTGVISGIPTESGIFSIILTASNENTTATVTFKLTVQSTTVNGVIVASGDAKNTIEWNPIQDFSYNIKRSTTSGGPYTTIGTTVGTAYTDTAVNNGSIYYYVVSAVDAIGEKPNSTEVLATPNLGQVSYLKFDELSGTKCIDSWGANHGILASTASRSTGKYEEALKLDGTANSYATLPTAIVSTLNDFTISAWVKMDALANWMRVFDFGTGTAKYMFLSVQTGSAGSIRYAIKNGGSEQGITHNFTTPINTWTHFAVTQSGNTCRLYINGISVANSTGITIKPATIGSTNLNYLGKSQWNDPMFKGAIDEFKIYSRALSDLEIAQSAKLNQTISLAAVAQKEMGDADYSPAIASSGLTVNYTSSNSEVATIVNGKIHIVGTGITSVTASQSGDETYNQAADVSQTLTVTATLKVKYQDGDNNLTNNQIKPNLTIYNEGALAIPYDELTLRYWITPENYTSINTWVDYAQIGNSKVKMKYIALPEPRNGAFGYVEYSFETTAGNLLAGDNSGQIQSRFATNNWFNQNENNDYSYSNINGFNERITMYRKGQLVWGIEPDVIPAVVKLKAYTETKSNASTNTISTYLKINNEGNVPVAYGDLKVRYWFTKEGTANLNYYLDYSALGNSNIESEFVVLNPIQNGANTYLELGLKASLGTFYPSSSTANIQYRITKTDWSNFNQSDDYSYKNNTTMALNDKVTIYYQGQLIYGTEPLITTSSKTSTEKQLKDITIDNNEEKAESVMLYPNPVIDILNVKVNKIHTNAKLDLYNFLGIKVKTQALTNVLGYMSLQGLPSGLYSLYITNGSDSIVKKVIKK